MTGPRRVLIVGGDSWIGRGVEAHFRAAGIESVATTRRPGAGRPFLDLATFDPESDSLHDVDAAILAAAVARLGDCAADPHTSARANMAGTLRLARHLAARGAHVVLLSTDKVFDGRLPRRLREAGVCPRTEYGRQKALAEAGVRALGATGAVLRLSKVLDPDNALIAGWIERLARAAAVEAFHDMYLAPVSRDLVARLLEGIVRARGAGIYQASGAGDVSYADLALRIAGRLGADADLVHLLAADPRAHPAEARPPHSTLDMSREAGEFGLLPPSVDETVEGLLRSAA